jgi:hypothetical protein
MLFSRSRFSASAVTIWFAQRSVPPDRSQRPAQRPHRSFAPSGECGANHGRSDAFVPRGWHDIGSRKHALSGRGDAVAGPGPCRLVDVTDAAAPARIGRRRDGLARLDDRPPGANPESAGHVHLLGCADPRASTANRSAVDDRCDVVARAVTVDNRGEEASDDADREETHQRGNAPGEHAHQGGRTAVELPPLDVREPSPVPIPPSHPSERSEGRLGRAIPRTSALTASERCQNNAAVDPGAEGRPGP